jgi:hypothetical protein
MDIFCNKVIAINKLGASGGQRGGKWLRNQNVRSKQPDTKYKLDF